MNPKSNGPIKDLLLRNRQRDVRLNLTKFRRIVQSALDDEFGLAQYELGIYLVGPRTMSKVNQTYLDHDGPTDVITFDYTKELGHCGGDLFLCPAVAVSQAGAFRTAWQSELVRYVVHGLLHLRGYDDTTPKARRLMKQQENRILRRLGARVPIKSLG